MNQSELAKRTGYSRFMISRILAGKRDASKVGAIRLERAVLGTKLLDWLFASKNFKRLAKIVRSTE